jgi:hypothetical protein
MLKKLFVTAAAAAAVSVPLAGVAWADPPSDPGSGNQGVPDRATGYVESTFGADALEGLQSGSSGVVAPGTAFQLGAKTDCDGAPCNTPDGYAAALNNFYVTQGFPNPGLERTIPGSAVTQFTPGCAHHSSGVCLP